MHLGFTVGSGFGAPSVNDGGVGSAVSFAAVPPRHLTPA